MRKRVTAVDEAVRRARLDVDVSDVAPAGCSRLRGELIWLGAGIEARAIAPVMVVCLPGGGMSRRYFDLPVPGYSMAAYLAQRGILVVTLDHPGIGESDVPDDAWALTPEMVADVDAEAVRQIQRQLASGLING